MFDCGNSCGVISHTLTFELTATNSFKGISEGKDVADEWQITIEK